MQKRTSIWVNLKSHNYDPNGRMNPKMEVLSSFDYRDRKKTEFEEIFFKKFFSGEFFEILRIISLLS